MENDRRMYTDWMAERMVAAGRVGGPYRPSNGVEAEIFQRIWCNRCFNNKETGCPILMDAWFFEIDDPGYPRDWLQIGPDGQPKCFGFVPEKEDSQ